MTHIESALCVLNYTWIVRKFQIGKFTNQWEFNEYKKRLSLNENEKNEWMEVQNKNYA